MSLVYSVYFIACAFIATIIWRSKPHSYPHFPPIFISPPARPIHWSRFPQCQLPVPHFIIPQFPTFSQIFSRPLATTGNVCRTNIRLRFLWGNPVDQPVDVHFILHAKRRFRWFDCAVYDLGLKIGNENIRIRKPRRRWSQWKFVRQAKQERSFVWKGGRIYKS